MYVGRGVGIPVGTSDGGLVGTGVGSCSVGKLVGIFDGAGDGAFDGCDVGTDVVGGCVM